MFTFRKIIFLTYFLVGSFFNGKAQQSYKIHSHNDYAQNIPFWKAYANNLQSIEIDVFLKSGVLYVTHDEKDINKNKTIETLYLQPLKEAKNIGLNAHQPVQFLIDIKSEAYSTLKALQKIIQKYPELLADTTITFVISGNRPAQADYSKYPSFILFDHQEPELQLSKEALQKIAMVSVDFKRYSEWNGKGRLTKEDEEKVKAIIKKAHQLKKPFRFWGAPDTKSAWKAFVDLGIDYINTDQPFLCSDYLKSLPNRWYKNTVFSEVYQPAFETDGTNEPVKNVILLIGDGNGLSQISAATLANKGSLTLTQLKKIGFLKTQSADDFTTDSAAAGTALATGQKTYNRAIGVDSQGNTSKNIIEILNTHQFLTGCITTDHMTGATPAAFYAHQKDRSMTDQIASDLLKSRLDLFIGGGAIEFQHLNLQSKFNILTSLTDLEKIESGKVGFFLSSENVPSVLNRRGNVLSEALHQSAVYFSKQQQPFFLMAEGAQIDSFGHENDTAGIVSETIDFDRAVTTAIGFADQNPGTLVLITADHETSGFAIPQGNVDQHQIEGDFITHDHTGTMVPVFAYGPQSDLFTGVYENNALFDKILQVLKIQ